MSNHLACHCFVLQLPPGLPNNSYLTLSVSDKTTIGRILTNKLGERAVEGQIRNKTTNRCESTHLSVLKSVPKNRTYRRNFRGRAHSAINSVSLGETNSICQANERLGASCSLTSPASRARKAEVRREKKNIERKRSRNFKVLKRICQQKKRRIHMQIQNAEHGYATGCQDPVVRDEHSYSK